ncbi:MAG: DUF2085 domain-containing protein [Pyrinomonadaceae bacterium]
MPASPANYISPFAPPRAFSWQRAWAAWFCVAAGALLWLGVVAGAPLAAARGHESSAFVLYQGLGAACHQMPERSYWLAGHPLAVCARCLGVYAGFAVAVLCYPLRASGLRCTESPRRAWIVLALLPTAIDFALGITGLWANTHSSRALTGAWLGVWTVFYVMPGLIDLGQSSIASSRRALFT